MRKPLVAIVGRPNVGKSTLFNKAIGRRIAIVEDSPGVTRDRIYGDAQWQRHTFTIIDTGGIEPRSEDTILQQMRRQAQLAVESADVIVFLVDGKEGVTPQDQDVAEMLRRAKKPIVLAVNKIDNIKYEDNKIDFYSLGIGEPVTISAEQSLGIGDLMDEIVKHLDVAEEEEDETVTRITVAGKPNVGKSSLVNLLLQDERTIVSNVPGTTRDPIDSPFRYNNEDYILVDTAGIRRKRSIEDETVERYSVIRSFSAIRRSDVVLVMIDATEGISEQDVRIAGFVHEEGKACVLLINKWDLVDKDSYTMDGFKKKIASDLAFMSYVPTLFISAKTGQRVNRIMELANYALEQNSRRISTGVLNDVISEAVAVSEPPSDKGRRLKIYYGTQVSVRPPTFVIFVNDANIVHFSYKRYLENYFRKTFKLDATPIRLIFRNRVSESGADNGRR